MARLSKAEVEAMRDRVRARLEAERPWWVFDFYEAGITIRARGRTLADAWSTAHTSRMVPPGCFRLGEQDPLTRRAAK